MRTSVQRIALAWVVTSVLTVASWFVATVWRGTHASASAVETFVVLAFAAVKARFIFGDFMEVRGAPSWLHRFTDGWIVVLWAAVVVTYLA